MTIAAVVLMTFLVLTMLFHTDTIEVERITPQKGDRCFACGEPLEGEGYLLLDGSDRLVCPNCYKR